MSSLECLDKYIHTNKNVEKWQMSSLERLDKYIHTNKNAGKWQMSSLERLEKYILIRMLENDKYHP